MPASFKNTQISFSFDEIMTAFVRKKGYGVDLTTWLAISAILNQLSTKWVEIHSVGAIFAIFTWKNTKRVRFYYQCLRNSYKKLVSNQLKLKVFSK